MYATSVSNPGFNVSDPNRSEASCLDLFRIVELLARLHGIGDGCHGLGREALWLE